MPQHALPAMLNIFIRQADAPRRDMRQAAFVQQFQHRAAESAHDNMLFNRDNFSGFPRKFQQQFRVKRLDETGVHDGGVNVFVG